MVAIKVRPFLFETGENVSISHFASNLKIFLCEFIKLNLFVSFEMGKDVSVSHFASYRKKYKQNWRT